MEAATLEGVPAHVRDALRALVEETRVSCLWFFGEGYVPETRDEALHVLRTIERHGDLRAYVRARELREWLSRTTSETSAGSSPETG